MADTQQLELIGRHRLIEDLIASQVEVALPMRDSGVDMIVYWNESNRFHAAPVQLKAASERSFSIFRKYEKHPGLILVFAWQILDQSRSTMLALTSREAVAVASDQGYTATASWRESGVYSVTRMADESDLLKRLAPFVVERRCWRDAARFWVLDPVDSAQRARDGDPSAARDLDGWLARQGIPMDGDWSAWRSEADQLARRPDAAQSLDRQRLRRALTVHRRHDRLSEGHWSALLADGTVSTLVRSLAEAPLDQAPHATGEHS
jgi:hypothetical protein